MYINYQPSADMKELAYYQPNWTWKSETLIKNALLFFDGIAVLLPQGAKMPIFKNADRAITDPLKDAGMLHTMFSEEVIDESVAIGLKKKIQFLQSAGVLNRIKTQLDEDYETLNLARLGGAMEKSPTSREIIEMLRSEGLADRIVRNEVKVKSTMRSLILIFLSELLIPYGTKRKWIFSPISDDTERLQTIKKVLQLREIPSIGRVVDFDIQTLGLDLTHIPIPEILEFRNRYYNDLLAYRMNVRNFVDELAGLQSDYQEVRIIQRKQELDEQLMQMGSLIPANWKSPTHVVLGVAHTVWKTFSDPVEFLLETGSNMSDEDPRKKLTGYSYMLKAQDELR